MDVDCTGLQAQINTGHRKARFEKYRNLSEIRVPRALHSLHPLWKTLIQVLDPRLLSARIELQMRVDTARRSWGPPVIYTHDNLWETLIPKLLP